MAPIRLLLVGDSGVGKSTLISSYISRHFPEDPPAVMLDSVIPQDKTSNNVTLTIMDSSARPGDREILHQKIRVADTILVLFDTTRPETLDSVVKEWLPLINEICIEEQGGGEEEEDAGVVTAASSSSSATTAAAAVVTAKTALTKGSSSSPPPPPAKTVAVVGTKKELLSDAESDAREKEEVAKVRQILCDFPFVHAYQRCSAKTLENVDNVFYLAEQAVTFPLAPLFDCDVGDFTPACKRAFERIFRIVDVDQDGLLSDQELETLQIKCFNSPLNRNEVSNIKKHIHQSTKSRGDGVGGITSPGIVANKLTFEGFLCFMETYIDKYNPEVPWIILKRFGYDDRLCLGIPPEVAVPPRGRDKLLTELSADADLFVRRLVAAAPSSSGSPGLISHRMLSAALSVLEPALMPHPWSAPPFFLPQALGEQDNLLLLSDYPLTSSSLRSFGQALSLPAAAGAGDDCLSEQAWLAHWRMLAMHCPATTQSLLFQLGFVERGDLGLCTTAVDRFASPPPASSSLGAEGPTPSSSPSPALQRRTLKTSIVGAKGAGKVSLVCALSAADGQSTTWLREVDSQPDGLSTAGGDLSQTSPPLTPERVSYSSSAGRLALLADGSLSSSSTSSLQLVGPSTPSARSVPSLPSLDGDQLENLPPPLASRRGLKTFVTGSRQFSFAPLSVPHAKFQSPVTIVTTSVPELCLFSWMVRHGQSCDVVVLTFDLGSLDSFQSAMRFEQLVPELVPRLYVGTKGDQQSASGDDKSGARSAAEAHLALHELPRLLVVSSASGAGVHELQRCIVELASAPWLGIPVSTRKKQTKQVLALRVGVGVALLGIAVAVGIILSRKK